MTPQDILPRLRDLDPASVRSARTLRYRGDGLDLTLDELAPEDRDRVREIYGIVQGAYLHWLDTRPAADWDGIWSRLEALGHEAFTERVAGLGEATAGGGDAARRSRVLHDVRGGALTAAILQVVMADGRPPRDGLRSLVHLCRDHAKIMRNALVDLDSTVRAADEAEKAHGIRDIVDKWSGSLHRVRDRAARVAVHSEYAGGISSCCLEVSAVDRVLYNLVNNAARFSADGTVALAILPHPSSSVRFGVANPIEPGQEAWIRENAGDASGLFREGTTRGGRGLGLANCASFVSRAYGVGASDEAVEAGLVGAEAADGRFLAWFHWPRLAPAA